MAQFASFLLFFFKVLIIKNVFFYPPIIQQDDDTSDKNSAHAYCVSTNTTSTEWRWVFAYRRTRRDGDFSDIKQLKKKLLFIFFMHWRGETQSSEGLTPDLFCTGAGIMGNINTLYSSHYFWGLESHCRSPLGASPAKRLLEQGSGRSFLFCSSVDVGK